MIHYHGCWFTQLVLLDRIVSYDQRGALAGRVILEGPPSYAGVNRRTASQVIGVSHVAAAAA